MVHGSQGKQYGDQLGDFIGGLVAHGRREAGASGEIMRQGEKP